MKSVDRENIESLMRSNRFDNAIEACHEILSAQPKNVDANYYLAVCLRYSKRLMEAHDVLINLRKIAPEHGRIHQEIGHTNLAMGNLLDAFNAFRAAVQLNPSLKAALAGQIDILLKWDQLTEAKKLKLKMERLLQMPPALVAAIDMMSQGKLAKAEKLCRDFLSKTPHNVDAMRILAQIGIKLNILHDPEFLLESALKLDPNDEDLRVDYVEVLKKRQKLQMAHEEILILRDKSSENTQYQSLHGISCMQLGEYDEALKHFENILKKVPGDPGTLIFKGHVLKTCGNGDDAILSYKAATRSSIGFGEAWHSLANLKTFSFSSDEINLMENQLQNSALTFHDRVNLNFALGKAYEDINDIKTSFRHYKAGNDLKKRRSNYNSEQITNEFQRQKVVFRTDIVKKVGQVGYNASDPIFVVGLPRAGSTLLEQILSSHSKVDGTLELPNILSLVNELRRNKKIEGDHRYPLILEQISSEEFRKFGKDYIEDTIIHRKHAPLFIDKMPNNFRHIGLIKLMLPNAKIIDARRHPMACCFSGFKQLFAEGQEFSNDLEDIGKYYCDYVDLMDFWHLKFPYQILHVQYEDVVNNFEGQVKRILEYCELPFEEACLSFYKTERAVRTPSSEQVRQPIYKGGLEQWRKFEEFLGPLEKIVRPYL